MDSVFIEGLELHAHHGVSANERDSGHRFRFDVRLYLDTRPAAASDDLAHTASYAEAARVIVEEASRHRVKLVERLADLIVRALFEALPAVKRIQLKVAKLSPQVEAQVEAAGVEIARDRE